MRVARTSMAVLAALVTCGACGVSTPTGDQPAGARTATSVSITVHEPVGLAVGAGKVWAVSVHDGDVIGRTSPDGPPAMQVHVGTTPLRAAFDGHLLWVSVFGADQVVAIDPARGRVVRRVRVPGQPEGLAAAFGAVWVVRQQARLLTSIDSDGRVGVSFHLGQEPRLVTASAHYLFASNFTDGTITRIDPTSATVRTSPKLCAGAQDMAVAGDVLWVSCTPADTVAAVDINTMRETGHVTVPGEPDAIRVVGSTVYVTTTTGPSLVEIDPDKQHPSVTRRVTLGTAPALQDIANVDAVMFAGRWWVSSPVLDRVIVYSP